MITITLLGNPESIENALSECFDDLIANDVPITRIAIHDWLIQCKSCSIYWRNIAVRRAISRLARVHGISEKSIYETPVKHRLHHYKVEVEEGYDKMRRRKPEPVFYGTDRASELEALNAAHQFIDKVGSVSEGLRLLNILKSVSMVVKGS